MTTVISKTDDYIDTRDITARIKEIEKEIEFDDEDNDLGVFDKEEFKEELKSLKTFADDIGGYAFENENQLINELVFEDYAQQLAEDIGAIDRDMNWPANCIDWERAANKLKMDYCDVDWDGETFYYRA